MTVYCPGTFEIFQVRTNQVMTVSDFKRRIGLKFDTTYDNVVLSYGDKELRGNEENKGRRSRRGSIVG